MFRWYGYLPGAASLGLLVLRLVIGAALIIHGSSKIRDDTGWNFQNATGWMNKFPSPPPPYLQAAAVVAEFGGGIALVIGFLTPLFCIMIACTMAVAAFTVHIPHGDPFVNIHGGPSFELAAAYFAVAVCLLLVGPGQLSLDYCLFGRRRTPANLPPYVVR
jgi:putative oxidoreductase